jgi:hypothetical protein
MKKRDRHIVKEAVVLLIAAAMIISALPAAMANTEDEKDFIWEETKAPPVIGPFAHALGETETVPIPSNLMVSPAPLTIPTNAFGGSGGLGDWLFFDDGVNVNSLGLTAGGQWEFGIRLTPAELAPYDGYEVTMVRFHYGMEGGTPNPDMSCEVRIYAGDTPTNPTEPAIYTEAFMATGGSGWIDIPLTGLALPVVNGAEDLWVMIWADQPGGTFPAGMDAGPAVDGKGDWLNAPGIGYPWTEIQTLGFDENFQVRCFVEEPPAPPGGCDFDVQIIDPVGIVNSMPKTIKVRVENKGPVPINEVKKLYDIHEMVPGATSEIFVDGFEGDLSCWAIGDNGDGDSWTLSDTRVHSGNYSMRCTEGIDRPDAVQDTYLGHAADSGPDTLELICDLNMAGASQGTISFWHWCQGESYVNVNGAVVPTDYGTIAISNNGGADYMILPQSAFVAYDNGWEEVTVHFNNPDPVVAPDVNINMPLTDQMRIMFIWHSDPHMEYEGWYIDDVSSTRTEEPSWKLIDQGWSIQSLDAFEVREEEFPLPWTDMESCKWYRICVQGQVFDPAGCEQIFDNNQHCVLVKVLDLCDVGAISITGPEAIEKSNTETYTVEVQNFGTLPANDVQVDLKICRMQEDTLFEDDFEGAGKWNAYFFVGDYIQDWFFHVTDFDAYSGSRSLACFDESPAGYPNLVAKMGQLALIAETGDPNIFDFSSPSNVYGRMSFYAKYSFNPGDDWGIALMDPDIGWIWFAIDSLAGFMMTGFQNEWYGMPDNPGGFPEFYDVDLVAIMDEMRVLTGGAMFADEFGNLDPRCAVGFAVFTNDDGCVYNPANPEVWSGLMIDDVRVYEGYCGPQCDIVDTCVIPFIDIGGIETIELEWHADQFCSFCVCAETSLACDENPANDMVCMVTQVTEIFDDMPTDEAGEPPWDHVDLTDIGGSAWHVVSKTENFGPEPPTDQYFWCGIDAPGIYQPNMDDSLISEVFSLQGADKAVILMDTYYDFGAGDCGEVWYSDDAGTHWYLAGTLSGGDMPPYEDWAVAGFDIPGEHCTDEMQIKFRFISDAVDERNGWYIDDISVNPLVFEGLVMDESFGDLPGAAFPPPGWAVVDNTKGGMWEQTSTRPSSFPYYGASPFWAVADSDANYGVLFDTSLWTPGFAVGGTTLTVEFDMYFTYYISEDAIVNLYSDGSFVAELAHYTTYNSGHKTLTYPIASIPGSQTDVQIEFLYKDNNNWGYYFAVDNVNIHDDSFGPILSENFGAPSPPPGGFPPGWITVQTTTETNYGYPCYWAVYGEGGLPSYASDGLYSAGLWWGNQGQDEWLISPEFDWSDGSVGTLTLDSDNFGHYSIPGYYWEGDYVKATSHWTGDHTTTSWITLGNLFDLAPGYTGALIWHTHSFGIGSGDAVRFAFHRYANWGDDGSLYGNLGIWHVDDVELDKWSPQAAVFEEDCEDAVINTFGTWTATGTYAGDWWQLTRPALNAFGPDDACEGDYAWWCGDLDAGTYPTTGVGLNNALFAVFDLEGPVEAPIFAATLEFCHWGDIGPGAAGYVEISDDGGATWHNMYEVPHIDAMLNPVTQWDWETVFINLDTFIPNEIIVRFRFTGPGCGCNCGSPPATAEGWYIDNIIIHYKYVTYYDTHPPITTICEEDGEIVLLAHDPNWPPEPTSGVCETWYKINDGPQQDYLATGPFTIGEGTTKVTYWSVDCAGNPESPNDAYFVIDTTPPTVTITRPKAGWLYLFDNELMERLFGTDTLCIGKITIAADASDTGTGVTMVTFEVDGDSGFDTATPYEYTYDTFKLYETVTVTAIAYDGAGNPSAPATTSFIKLL